MSAPRRPRPRLEQLSDLIYGLSLSIGAISLVLTSEKATTPNEINSNILQFVFVFLLLITSWLIYTADMSVLPVETRLIASLNVVLLILVVIIPYLFDQVVSVHNSSEVQDYASVLFTADLAGTLVIMAGFAHIIALEEKNLVDREVMVRFRAARDRIIVLIGVVLGGLAVPWDWTLQQVHVRLLIWCIPIISYWFNRMRQASLVRTVTKQETEVPI